MSSAHFDVIFAGNYLTALVGALPLAENGKKVCIVNPVPSWGGHFSRVRVGEQSFDPGAVSFEFTVFADRTSPDPADFDARKRNDVARFNALIEDYIGGQIELNKMMSPETVYRGGFYPDIVMTNRFELLHDPHLAGRVRAEQQHLAANPVSAWHPRAKKTSEMFVQKSYYEASLANHGATLHSAVFEPQFFKMSGLSSTRLIALYHRIAWLPLYYPETLLSQFGPEPQILPETFFCYPRAGFIGKLGEVLVKKLEAAGATILREPIASLKGGAKPAVTLKDGRRLESAHVVWSLAHDQIFAQATGDSPNKFERWSAVLVFANVRRSDLLRTFSVLYCPDDESLFYRACNQTESSGLDEEIARIVVEVNPDYAAARGFADEAACISRVREDFCRLGIISEPEHLQVAAAKTLRNVLLLPSVENWHLLERERDVLLSSFPNVVFTRNVEAFFTDTLNDQIIKGLKLAAQLGDG